jgi:hypothetical protein
MTQPLWLKDPAIQKFLGKLVDKLDSADAQGKELVRAVKVDLTSFPHFFNAELESERERLWACLQEIVRWGWLELKLDRAKPGQVAYERNPRVQVTDENALRRVTNRLERVRSVGELWREAVLLNLDSSDVVKEQISRYRIEIPGKDSKSIVEQLNKLHELADEPLLLREVSARLFWGQSKVLDGRQQLVAILLKQEECPFPEMPVQLQVFLPSDGFEGVLFIENQATFEQATRDGSGRYAGLALVFASGFKGSAKRLRSPTGASVYFAAHGTLEEKKTAKFLGWLRAGVKLQSWFWGDLDYSGMRILAALRGVFLGLSAWEPGYRPMLERLRAGDGHAPDGAGKGGQGVIDTTGCSYADTFLLPAIRNLERFLDQELV